jgi:N-acyl homoserine lactone hydrolase
MERKQFTNGPFYQVQMFRTGACRVKGRYAYRNYGKDQDHPYAIYIGVIKGNGITALVDTGMASVAAMNRGAGFLLSELITQQPGEDTESILQKAGVEPDEVDYIFLTHCHYDHCSQLALFPNAKIVIPAYAWQVWHTTEDGAVYLHDGFLDYLNQLNHEKRLLCLDEGMVVPGISVCWIGGHSPCSQFIYIKTVIGTVLFTGDTVQLYGNIEHNDIIGILINEEQCWHALDIARTHADVLIPGHDPLVLEKYPDGIIG